MPPAVTPEEQLLRTQLKEALKELLPVYELLPAHPSYDTRHYYGVDVLHDLISALETPENDGRLRQALPDFYGPMFGRDRDILLGIETLGILKAGAAAHIHSLYIKLARMISARYAPHHKRGLLERLHDIWLWASRAR